ncbi:rhomboid family intramembrane serine protease [Piscinibacter sp. Jin2]|uniref:Rhomboid family intramembrane serine protease n=1 Tax=Aquariibacter lacus TaxID=2801332 RepID=A0A9X0XD72_9BURK|nr:rhomboid family intramembrane serine protease [Piscinibacter lacus]MBL0719361.1 rhomboid family intramembrane serine protease [Piscinibacter lacus]
MPPMPPITKALILACVGFYCATLLLPPWFEGLLALWPMATGNFQPWQPISYAFMHGSPGHLLFNMLGLWSFGSELERLWGGRRYVHFLIASVLAAAVVQQLWTAAIGSPVPTVGASGGLFGLLLAFGMLFPNRQIMMLIPPMPIKAKHYVMIFGGLELLLGFSGGSGIAHFAHLGGMLGGFLMLRYWGGRPPFGRR